MAIYNKMTALQRFVTKHYTRRTHLFFNWYTLLQKIVTPKKFSNIALLICTC